MIKLPRIDITEYLGRNIKDLFISERKLILREAYLIINDYRALQNGEACEVAYGDFIKSYNKVCREFFGSYYDKRRMQVLKHKPPRINKL